VYRGDRFSICALSFPVLLLLSLHSTKNGGLNGHLFCVNNGQCKNDPFQGCDCIEPYNGFSCEFVDNELTDGDNEGGDVLGEEGSAPGGAYGDYYDEEDNWTDVETYHAPEVGKCDLQCDNGGVCRVGLKQTGFLEDLSKNAPHLNKTDDNFMHCVCPDGFYGLYCEEEVDVCGDGDHYCLYGSTCIPAGQDDGEGHKCDCVDTNSEIADVFAGNSCEHPVNDICTVDTIVDTTPLSFCVNGGTCKRRVQVGES